MSSCRFAAGFAVLPKFLLGLALISGLSACASTGDHHQEGQAVSRVGQTTSDDPFESINRKVFAFNYRLDQWLLRPVAKGYVTVTPQPVRTGVTNFFSNLGDLTNTANDVLQWKWRAAGNDGGRFLLNSTVGLLGFFDVAVKAGLHKNDGEDFGQTLAVWGLDSGPYLMLPLLGPATVRDGAAMVADGYMYPLFYVDPHSAQYSLLALEVVDGRAQLLQTDSLLTGDSYVLVRDFYLQRRNYLINDGEVEDDFGGGGYGDDYYYDDYDSDGYEGDQYGGGDYE